VTNPREFLLKLYDNLHILQEREADYGGLAAPLWLINQIEHYGRLLTGHDFGVNTVAFSPDGQTLASGSDDDSIILWTVASGQPLGKLLTGHNDEVNSVAFSPDGQTLASGSEDTTIRLWDLNPESWHARACRRANRDLTQAEWDEFIGSAKQYQPTCPDLPLLRLLDAARRLATAGDVESAVARFREALTLDPSLAFDPETEARRLTAQSLLAEGRELATANQVEEAVARFERALELDPSLDLDPEAEARQFAAVGLVEEGQSFYDQGQITDALAAFEAAQTLDPDVAISAVSWNNLCWFGSLEGYAAELMNACEQAVTLAPKNEWIRDSRGLARALTGDTEGAIEDFEYYVAETDDPDELEAERGAWIADLKAGHNPFDEETLQALR
jgi:tetratricopeptide (TPR) repeat protein